MPSQVIRRFTYETSLGRLVVTFVNGRRYAYDGVPEALASEMKQAFAKGVFFNRRIRDRYPSRRLPEAGDPGEPCDDVPAASREGSAETAAAVTPGRASD